MFDKIKTYFRTSGFELRVPVLIMGFIVVTFTITSSFSSLRKSKKDILEPLSTLIITPDKPDPLETKSALTISKWLKKIYRTDRGFNVVKQSFTTDIEGRTIIAVGKTKFSSLDDIQNLSPYSFVIKRRENIATICGGNSLGTFIGTGYFLDHFCGVRFYIPGDLFTSIPMKSEIELDKKINLKETPSTKFVNSTGYRSQEVNWALINALSMKNWGSHQHSMGDRFLNDSIIKKFPKIFPIINGKRYFPTSKADQKWQPDFAEPELIDAAAYSAVNYFRSNPSIDYIAFSVQDSRIYPKEGSMGEFLKSYPSTPVGRLAAYTEANAEFLNKLAKRLRTILPENGITRPKTIVYIAYSEVSKIPEIKLDSSILPIIVFHVAETLMDSVYQEGRDGLKNYRLSEWAKVTSRIGNHDWAEGKGFIYPRIYTNLVSKFARTIKKDNMQFEYAHIEAYPNWGLDGPKLYFMGKIYWNPQVNTDSLLTQFCNDMFGSANNIMKDYFVTLENLNTSMNNDPKRNRRLGSYITQLPLNENELKLVQEARNLLDKAAKKTSSVDEKKRIEFFSTGFKVSEYFFDLYNSKVYNEQKVAELKNYLKNTIAGDSMMLNIATDSDFLQKMNLKY